MATANHFWLDVLAGIAVALVAMAVVSKLTSKVTRTRAPEPPSEPASEGRPIANVL
jgi:putative Ca2+/H+ antiporter (TMEM165/GDT1 family)